MREVDLCVCGDSVIDYGWGLIEWSIMCRRGRFEMELVLYGWEGVEKLFLYVCFCVFF